MVQPPASGTIPCTSSSAAVAQAIDDATLPQPVTVERSWLPIHDLADLADTVVSVMPAGQTTEPIGRSRRKRQYRVEVGVQRKLTTDEASEIDDLVTLSDAVAALFERRSLAFDLRPADAGSEDLMRVYGAAYDRALRRSGPARTDVGPRPATRARRSSRLARAEAGPQAGPAFSAARTDRDLVRSLPHRRRARTSTPATPP